MGSDGFLCGWARSGLRRLYLYCEELKRFALVWAAKPEVVCFSRSGGGGFQDEFRPLRCGSSGL